MWTLLNEDMMLQDVCSSLFWTLPKESIKTKTRKLYEKIMHSQTTLTI